MVVALVSFYSNPPASVSTVVYPLQASAMAVRVLTASVITSRNAFDQPTQVAPFKGTTHGADCQSTRQTSGGAATAVIALCADNSAIRTVRIPGLDPIDIQQVPLSIAIVPYTGVYPTNTNSVLHA